MHFVAPGRSKDAWIGRETPLLTATKAATWPCAIAYIVAYTLLYVICNQVARSYGISSVGRCRHAFVAKNRQLPVLQKPILLDSRYYMKLCALWHQKTILLNGCSLRATPGRWLYGALQAYQTSLAEEWGRTLEPHATDLTGGKLPSIPEKSGTEPCRCQELKRLHPDYGVQPENISHD